MSVTPSPLTPQQYGARGDGVADDTGAIQAAINASHALAAAVDLPGGVYVTTSTVTMRSGVTLRGAAAMGAAQPRLEYRGTGTALAVGDGTAYCYAVVLENVLLTVPHGATAAVAISLRRVSGATFRDVAIGANATSGKFTVGWRIEDSGILTFMRPVISNLLGLTGSTAFQFVNSVNGAHNAHINLIGGDIFAMDTVFDLRDMYHLTVRDVWCERNGTIVLCDQTQCASLDALDLQVTDLLLDGNTFLLNGVSGEQTYPNQRVIAAIGAAGKTLALDLLTVRSNRIYCATPVTYPFRFDLAAATFDTRRLPTLVLDGNYLQGVDTAVTYADTPNVTVRTSGYNFVRTAALAVPALGAGALTVQGSLN